MSEQENIKDHFIGLHIDAALAAQVKDAAWQARKSVSQFVREILTSALDTSSDVEAASTEAA